MQGINSKSLLQFQELCEDLENRQFTLDTVNKKVAEVVQALSVKDREDMENSVKKLTHEHERVYTVAVEHRNVLSLALNAREVYQFGLERVDQWMDERAEKLKNLEPLKLSSAEVEKQAEKAKVRVGNKRIE